MMFSVINLIQVTLPSMLLLLVRSHQMEEINYESGDTSDGNDNK